MMLGGGWKKREKKWTYVICDWFQRVEGLLLLNMEGLNEAGLWIEKVEAWSPLSLFFLFLSFSFSLFPPPPVLCPPIQIKGVKKIPSGPIGAVLRLIRLSFRAHSAPLSNGGPSLSVERFHIHLHLFVWFGAAARRRRGRTKEEKGKYSFNGFFTALRCFLCPPFTANSSPRRESRKRKKYRKSCQKGDEERREAVGLKSDPMLTNTWEAESVLLCRWRRRMGWGGGVNACACALMH